MGLPRIHSIAMEPQQWAIQYRGGKGTSKWWRSIQTDSNYFRLRDMYWQWMESEPRHRRNRWRFVELTVLIQEIPKAKPKRRSIAYG